MNEQIVSISIDGTSIEGSLVMPEHASALVLFAHGSGSSRFSPRNTFVARVLNQAGLATLLVDLLTEEEDRVYETRFNIDLLTERLERVTAWLKGQGETKELTLGYFGSSTGAAAALRAAAALGDEVAAIVSRGGRPDLAIEVLPDVQSPTLLIVGGDDHGVIELNEQAYAVLQCQKKLEIIPGATHLFEEPRKLEEVASIAQEWFVQYLQSPSPTSREGAR